FPFIYGECGVVDFRRWSIAGMTQDLKSRDLVLVSSARHSGVFYVITNILIWGIQHLVPGSLVTWRSPRTAVAYCREGLLAFLTFPLHLVSWLAMALDGLLPELGCYTGALIFSQRSQTKDSGVNT